MRRLKLTQPLKIERAAQTALRNCAAAGEVRRLRRVDWGTVDAEAFWALAASPHTAPAPDAPPRLV